MTTTRTERAAARRRSPSDPRARRGGDAEPAAPPERADRAALALAAILALLLVARAVLSFVPGTWLWPLSVQRFLSPVLHWAPWLVMALGLVPPVARRALPVIAAWGDAITRHPGRSTAAWAVAGAALVLALPDQVRFVGDFLLRQGTVEIVEQPHILFPQALPLDVFLHYTLPLKITTLKLLDANGAARALGALEAAMLAALATAFARGLALRGAAAFACAAVVFFGGYLGMFTGFSKAFAEMCVLVAVAGVSAVRVIRTGRGLLPLGAAIALALALHRSALGMLPALLLVWLWWWRSGRAGGWKQADALLGFALPLTTLAIMAPRIAATVIGTDATVHFAPPAVQQQGGVLRAALAGTRPFDLTSIVLLLSPLAIAIPPLAVLLGRLPGRGREALVLAVLALPFVAVMPFIHPAQGLYRDWDDFAATGVALSLLAAWLVGETLRGSPRHAWLALAVTLGVAAPAVQWLAAHADTRRGLERVRAFVQEPPLRTPAERGMTWDYLGIRNYRLERYAEAQVAFERAIETAPSPRILQEWAVTATQAGDIRTAQRAYQRLLAKMPDDPFGWLGLAAMSMRLRDVPEAKRAALGLRRLVPDSPEAATILADIARYEALQADSLRRVQGR